MARDEYRRVPEATRCSGSKSESDRNASGGRDEGDDDEGKKELCPQLSKFEGGKLSLIILYLPRVLVELGILQISGKLQNEIFKGNGVATSEHLERLWHWN